MTKSTVVTLGLGVLAISLIAGIAFLAKKPEARIVARVGAQSISQSDLDLYGKAKDCYGARPQNSALVSELVNNAIEQEVLKIAFQREPQISDLEAQAKWVDENSKAPDTLRCVKNAFASDHSAFLKLYIAPTIVNPKIHAEFSLSMSIHQAQQNRIEAIWKEAQAGKNLKDFPEYRTFEIAKKQDNPVVPSGSGAEFGPNLFVDNVVKKMKVGDTWPHIVEDDNSFQIVRFIKEDDSKYYLDGVMVLKIPFDTWFQKITKDKIKIIIEDSALRAQIKKDYPSLWWAGGL